MQKPGRFHTLCCILEVYCDLQHLLLYKYQPQATKWKYQLSYLFNIPWCFNFQPPPLLFPNHMETVVHIWTETSVDIIKWGFFFLLIKQQLLLHFWQVGVPLERTVSTTELRFIAPLFLQYRTSLLLTDITIRKFTNCVLRKVDVIHSFS